VRFLIHPSASDSFVIWKPDHKSYIGYEKPTPDLPHLLRHPDSYREADSVSKAVGDLFYFGWRILDGGFGGIPSIQAFFKGRLNYNYLNLKSSL